MDTAISKLRVLAMLFIVFYHSICYYGVWKFASGVVYDSIEYWRYASYVVLNLFVFLSGVLFANIYINRGGYKCIGSFLNEKAKRLFVPYIVWAVPATILFHTSVLNLFSGCQHLWFLLMLGGVMIVSRLLIEKLLRVNITIFLFIVFILLFANQLVHKFGERLIDIFAWKRVLHYLPVFIWAIGLVKFRIIEKMRGLSMGSLMSGFLISLSIVILFALIPVLPFGLLYKEVPVYVFLLFLYLVVSKCKILEHSKILYSLDKHSMGIYILHHLLIWAILSFVPGISSFMNAHMLLSPVLLFLFVLASSWGLSVCAHNYRCTSIMLGSKWKK